MKLSKFSKVIFVTAITMSLAIASAYAQISFVPGGTWDAGYHSTNAGTIVHNNGVVQLVSIAPVAGAEGAAVHETSNPVVTGVSWSRCYNVFFGCPGNDNIGSDEQGDGMAWSLYDPTYSGCNLTNGIGGGGLGYNSTGCGRMFTIEFDTYSSPFDGTYGGGTSGNHDEIAIQVNGNADGTTANKLTAVDAGNLEDGQEHEVCISYTPSGTYAGGYNGTIVVKIDGVTKLSYALGNTYSLERYFDPHPLSGGSSGPPYSNNDVFDAGNLAQMWSSGKQNATNPATVTPNATIHIIPNLNSGSTLCPSSVAVSATAQDCSDDYKISATVNPPAGYTTSQVQFFEDGNPIGTDATSPYSVTRTPASSGNHTYTATATFSGAGGTKTSSPLVVNTGNNSGIQLTNTAPSIDGTIDAIWSDYPSIAMTQFPVGPAVGASDLSGYFKTMRDATYLYILVDMTDNVVMNGQTNNWDNDGIEVFFDMGHERAATFDANDYQYGFVYGITSVTEYKHNSTTGVSYSTALKTGGYITEIRIPWTALGLTGVPANGTEIGFDVHANDNDDGGGRDTKIAWNDATDIAHNDPRGFGSIILSDCTPPEEKPPVKPEEPVVITIPNLITPNNDQKNDHFEILSLPANSALKVFNRWGDKVYQSSSYDNQWAGNNNSDGVYYYDLTLPDGRHYKGWLNIVR